MQTLQHGYRGLHLLVKLNLDRVMWPAAVAAALMIGGYAASL
jgi:ppGpp synthetase/RelA/SpoT-type nucleotidyltranferase